MGTINSFQLKKENFCARSARAGVCAHVFWWQLLMFCAGGCASVLVCGCVSVWVSAVLRAQSGPIWGGGLVTDTGDCGATPLGATLGTPLGLPLGCPPEAVQTQTQK